MKEVLFLKKNKDRWRRFEQALDSAAYTEPDELADLFVEVTDDLSYARTFYPRSKTRAYLNELAGRVYLTIYENKRESFAKIFDFWRKELPILLYASFPALALSFFIFILAALIGFLSAEKDPDFTRMVLGSEYVEMTIQNIRKGDPTGVYKDENAVYMFLRIALNNILVSFGIFALGIIGGFGSIFMPSPLGGTYGLAPNGIMIGVFFHLFYAHNAHGLAWPVVMVHGTIELACVVIAAAAGLTMGGGWLFPGTHTRLESFRQSARVGLRIIVGLIPFFIAAALLEAFVTRYSNMPKWIMLFILAASAALMIGYFVVYPFYVHYKNKNETAL